MATASSHRTPNRLIHETSPYLLQHAHNPVQWFPWGEEAFAAATAADKPIFLSVGYSTCHWCHVMEEESFEDDEVAAFLNERFVSIKVDREERPDIDSLYMTTVQMMSGQGGWPMTVILQPDKRPFFGGTYFPARDGDRGARMGFLTLLRKIDEVWRTDRARVTESAASLWAELEPAFRAPRPGDVPGIDVVDGAVARIAARYDDVHGGLLPAPKFPSSTPIRLLLRHAQRKGDAHARKMAHDTFLKMARGGLYDHVGGGFHRYSTDEQWLIPHFEKMLYDNALLVTAGVELWQATRDDEVKRVIKDVLAYVQREMTSSSGAFFSATDADSLDHAGKREEGWYFTWELGELRATLAEVLSAEESTRVIAAWGATERGNFEGRNILHLARAVDADTRALFERARPALRARRDWRPLPLRDEKILAAWNGLMITAFARAGFAFAEDALVQVAAGAARFVLAHMRGPDGRLHRSHKDGRARHAGVLDDHAHMVAALLDLFEATAELSWLNEACALADVVERHFAAPEGGYHLSAADVADVLAREKPAHDGAEPGGNSVHALSLLRLHVLTDDESYRTRATRTLAAFSQHLQRHPSALHEMLLALEWLRGAPLQIAATGALEGAVREAFVPSRVAVAAAPDALERAGQRVPFLRGKGAVTNVAYVCREGVCELPSTTTDALAHALERKS